MKMDTTYVYKTGEEPREGDRIQAPPTTKTGAPRVGRVVYTRSYIRLNDRPGVRVEWEIGSIKHSTPKTSTLRPEVLQKIDELPGVIEASDLCHKIASILGRSYGYGDKCRLRDGRIVTLSDFNTAIRIEQLVLVGVAS